MLPADAIEHPKYKGYWYSCSYDKVYRKQDKVVYEKKFTVENSKYPYVQMYINKKRTYVRKEVFILDCLGLDTDRIGLPDSAVNHFLYSDYAYEPNSGDIYTKWNRGPIWKKLKTSKNINGYYTMSISHQNKKRTYSAHKFAAECMLGEPVPDKHQVDHRQQNKADNRWSELRVIPRLMNHYNHMVPAGYMVVEIEEWERLMSYENNI